MAETLTHAAPEAVETVDLELAMRQLQGLHIQLDNLAQLLDYRNGLLHEFEQLRDKTITQHNEVAGQVRELRRLIETERARRFGDDETSPRRRRGGRPKNNGGG